MLLIAPIMFKKLFESISLQKSLDSLQKKEKKEQ